MKTVFYSYQARFVVTGLTNLAEELELAEMSEWHTIARAAACLESLLYGEQPADIANVVDGLKSMNLSNPAPRRSGQFTFILIDLTVVLLEGIRLGLLDILPKLQRPKLIAPLWIGIDLGTGDRTVLGGRDA